MKSVNRRMVRCGLAAGLLMLIVTVPLMAGPPLICHPFQIEGAKSLPWAKGAGWKTPDPNYDTGQLVADSLALLAPGTPVIVRMEALRRAAIYSMKDPTLAMALFERLKSRAEMTKGIGRDPALALFDAGYFAATLQQAHYVSERPAAVTVDGYAWVQKAIKTAGGDPQMEFAAALITTKNPRDSRHENHFRNAVAGATEGSLLAQNLVSHFSGRGQNLDSMRAQLAANR